MPPFDLALVTDLLRQLVACPSVSSANPALDQPNQGVVDLLKNWLAPLGFALEEMPVAQHPRKVNLLARLGQPHGPSRDALVLCGHSDTVPADPHRWSTPPFTLTQNGERLHGLGASDMKGFAAVLVALLMGLHHEGFLAGPHRRPLTLLFTADEESGMDGARLLMQRGEPPGAFCLIGEPTGMALVNRHKGIVWASVTLTGQAAHASRPDLGRNALEGMHRVMGALLDWRDELNQRFPGQPDLGPVPGPTVNLGALNGGDAPNRVCPRAELLVDVRLVAGMDPEAIQQELAQVAQTAVAGLGLGCAVNWPYPGTACFDTPAHRPFVQELQTLLGQRAQAVAFGTEGPFFAALGVDTLILGPGHIEQAHQPDEYVELSQLAQAHGVYEKILRRFLAEESW